MRYARLAQHPAERTQPGPDVGLPKALTVFEALTGQVFLVTMVARLVTLWGRQGTPGSDR